MKRNTFALFAATSFAVAAWIGIGYGGDGTPRPVETGTAARVAPRRPAEKGEAEQAGKPEGRTGDAERESEEEKETAEELRMRARIAEQLKKHRAATCGEAIAKIEGLLRKGKGRWDQRNAKGGMPSDLIHDLGEAEVWAAQSEPVCEHDPKKKRFEELRSLMAAIWQYPKVISHEALNKHLRALGQ